MNLHTHTYIYLHKHALRFAYYIPYGQDTHAHKCKFKLLYINLLYQFINVNDKYSTQEKAMARAHHYCTRTLTHWGLCTVHDALAIELLAHAH